MKYYRNIEEIDGVDEGCLWRLENGEQFVLVDDDEHVSLNVKEHKHFFREVPKPKELKE